MRTLFPFALAASAFVVVNVAACDPGADEGEGEGDEGEGEGEGEENVCGAPPPSDPCIPICGNEQGVGQPCTKDGGECNDYIGNGAGFCTADFSDTTLAYCTRPCSVDEDCGTNSRCVGDPEDPGGDTGCIPASCVENPVTP